MKKPATGPEWEEIVTRSRAVEKVAAGSRIIYTREFKAEFLARRAAGERPTAIFRSVGLPPELIGEKRIERCTAHWERDQDEPSRHNHDRVKERITRLTKRMDRLDALADDDALGHAVGFDDMDDEPWY